MARIDREGFTQYLVPGRAAKGRRTHPRGSQGILWAERLANTSDEGQPLVMSEMFNPDPDTAPFTGTGPFEVTEGADVLGCTTGTTADQGIVGEFEPAFDRVWTCESGDRAGTFTARIELAGGDFEFWTWEITATTGDFAGLQGGGDGQSEGVTEDANGGIQWVDTYTGDIEYGS